MENNITQIAKQYPNDMELGSKIREMANTTYIYESPDGGKTITKRPFGGDIIERELIQKPILSEGDKKDAYAILHTYSEEAILEAARVLNNK